MILYHGSENIIEKPLFGFGKAYNDYGLGFYCTDSIEMAKEWGAGLNKNGFANKYEIDTSNLRTLHLNDKKYSILNWLSILLQNHKTVRCPMKNIKLKSLAAAALMSVCIPAFAQENEAVIADNIVYSRAFVKGQERNVVFVDESPCYEIMTRSTAEAAKLFFLFRNMFA